MFSTVKEVHIAIDTYLQQLNSNRKQSFRPEQYDLLVNTELRQYIEDKTDPKGNPKKEGFENNQRRVDEMKDLKKSTTLRLYNDNYERKYCFIPSDYYKLITGGCTITVHYNKQLLSLISNNETKNIYIISFPDDNPVSQGTQVYQNITLASTSSFTETFSKPEYSKDAKFEIINYFIDYLRKDKGYEVYWEYYCGIYYSSQFIIITPTALVNPITLVFTSGFNNNVITNTSTLTQPTLIYNTTNGNIIYSAIDLISSRDKREIIRNYYISKNRQNQPICHIDDNKFYTYYNNTFSPISIDFNYIIKPRLMNYYFNIMPEIEINNEIIERVVNKLKIFIKDEQAYNQFNNQLQQLQ